MPKHNARTEVSPSRPADAMPGVVAHEYDADGSNPPKQRHINLFPWWWAHLLVAVGPADAAAYVSVLMAYYQRSGQLIDDNKLLAELAGVAPKRWLVLREKLLAHGVARVENGRWIDDAHSYSIGIQLKVSQRQSAIAKAREQAKRAARATGSRP